MDLPGKFNRTISATYCTLAVHSLNQFQPLCRMIEFVSVFPYFGICSNRLVVCSFTESLNKRLAETLEKIKIQIKCSTIRIKRCCVKTEHVLPTSAFFSQALVDGMIIIHSVAVTPIENGPLVLHLD